MTKNGTESTLPVDFKAVFRRTLLLKSSLGLLVVSILLVLACIIPLTQRLKSEQEKHLFFAVKSRSSTVEIFLDKAIETAKQVTSRTQIRESLEKYNRQEITLAELADFTRPKLDDASTLSGNGVGVSRFDAHNTLIVFTGIPIPPQYWIFPNDREDFLIKGPERINGKLYLLVSAPILTRDHQRVGTDIVLFTTEKIQEITQDLSGFGKTGEMILGRLAQNSAQSFYPPRETSHLKEENELSRQKELDQAFATVTKAGSNALPCILREGHALKVGDRIKHTSWIILCSIDKDELYAPINTLIVSLGLFVTVLLAFGLYGMKRLLAPLADKAIVHTGKLQQELLEKQEVLKQREQAMASMHESEEKYRGIFNSSFDAIMILNPPTWRFTAGNPATIKMFGAKDEQHFISFDPWTLSADIQLDGRPSAEKAREMIETAMREGTNSFEWMHRRIDGEEFPADVLLTRMEWGGEAFLQATVRDITERKQAEQEILKAKEEWELTFEAIGDIATILDANHRILRANRQACKVLGLEREELVGKFCYEVFHGGTQPCNDCPAAFTVKDEAIHTAEIVHERLGKTFSVSAAPVFGPDNKQWSIICISRDVTELKALEGQFRQAQKMEAIGTLAGGIAHDFNNILTPILGYSELLIDRLASNSQEQGLVREIFNAGKRAKELVKQILTFGRQTERQQQPVQIHMIVREALKLLRASIPTTITIKQNVVDCGLVMADPTQIHQILMNLCTNAYHAMRETGGELGVSLSVVELTTQDSLDKFTLVPGPHVKLAVSDTGCGMSKELLERIFEPYFTTKKHGEGTGMGLSVVHGIVKSNHGHITVYSEPGRGTEFHFYLPQIATHGNDLAEKAVVPIPQGSGTILVVDDEVAVGQLLRELLLSLGYEVVLCSSSTQALETFQQNGARIDLVLTDMTMPTMNGAELIRRIKHLNPAMPVVLCTGFSDIMDEDKAKRMGIDGYLLKPVIKSQLAQTIYEIMRGK
ncbi:MAG: PAS domain S-box protein [Desulfocapsaceae bacterium]|nr:PAS domain S-box protein [Desulfocapsaceae bacterium]